MTINHSRVKGVEGLRMEHTKCSGISGKEVGEEETRSTNEAEAVGTVGTMATDRLEETPSHSSIFYFAYPKIPNKGHTSNKMGAPLF